MISTGDKPSPQRALLAVYCISIRLLTLPAVRGSVLLGNPWLLSHSVSPEENPWQTRKTPRDTKLSGAAPHESHSPLT